VARGGIETGSKLSAGGEQHIDALTDGAVTEGLGKMTFADADITDNEDGGALGLAFLDSHSQHRPYQI